MASLGSQAPIPRSPHCPSFRNSLALCPVPADRQHSSRPHREQTSLQNPQPAGESEAVIQEAPACPADEATGSYEAALAVPTKSRHAHEIARHSTALPPHLSEVSGAPFCLPVLRVAVRGRGLMGASRPPSRHPLGTVTGLRVALNENTAFLKN